MNVPTTVLLIGAGLTLVLLGLTAWWVYDEGSPRGVQRRAQDSGKTVAAGVGFGLASVVGVLTGFGEGAFASLGTVGSQLSGHAGFLTDLGIAGLGAGVVAGYWEPSSVYVFLAASGLVVVAGVLWRGK